MAQSAPMSLRMSPEQRDAITVAANACGKSKTAFIVDSAVERAQDVVLDRTGLILDSQQWEAIMSAPGGPADSSVMRQTLDTPPTWEE